MSYHSSENTWSGSWAQQSPGQNGAGYAYGAIGHHSRTARADTQPAVDGSYYQQRYTSHEVPQHPYGEQMHRASFSQRPVASASTQSAQTAARGFASSCQPTPYTNAVSQHSQQCVVVEPSSHTDLDADEYRSPTWSQFQPDPRVSGSQEVMQPHHYSVQVGYTGYQLPPVVPSV